MDKNNKFDIEIVGIDKKYIYEINKDKNSFGYIEIIGSKKIRFGSNGLYIIK